MRTTRATFSRFAGRVETLLDASAGAILVLLVAIVAWGVFTRFALGAASWWTEESARLLLVWLTMLGAAAASARAEHLGVDYFAGRLHPDARRFVAITVELTVIAFALAILVYGGLVLVIETLQSGQTTAAIGLRMGWVYVAVPLCGLGMILFSVQRLVDLVTGSNSLETGDPNSKRAG